MSEIVRTVRVDEEEPLERFLERCYGHRRGLWSRNWREGIPYTTLELNAINHPDERGMKLFADALMALFPQ